MPHFLQPLWRIAIIASLLILVIYSIKTLIDYQEAGDGIARRWIDLEEKDILTNPSRDKHSIFHIAIAPVLSPRKSFCLYQAFAEYMGTRLDKKSDLLIRENYAEVNDLVKYRRCDIAFICTYSYILGKNSFGMELLVAPQIKGSTVYHSLIIVPASARTSSLLDLRGKRFASSDILSTSGWCYLAAWLMQQGENPATFFSKHIITRGHDLSVSAVASGYVDGAGVYSIIYENMVQQMPSLASQVRIVHCSPAFGTAPIVVHPDMPSDFKRRIQQILLTMHKNPEGQKILEILEIDCFVVPDPEKYVSVEEIAKWVSPK